MFTLLNSKDKNVLKDSDFAKNAVFYKDMLCFYNAYNILMENKENLPNFCFKKQDEICLEGLCLLMKMYATEFKFETLKLSLDYLKILYYAIASYAEEDSVDSELIIAEFDSYRLASQDYCKQQQDGVNASKNELFNMQKETKEDSKKIVSMQTNSKRLKIAAWILLVLSALSISLPIIVRVNFTTASLYFKLSVVMVAIGFISTIVCFIISKKSADYAEDLTHHVQNLKKNIEVKINEFTQVQAKFYRILCEKYEYSMYFAELFSRFATPLSVDEILDKAKEYKLISYNIVYDINRLFKSQQKEIDAMIADIETLKISDKISAELSKIYSVINEQDWMYYNAEVRYHFLKKFTDSAEINHDWKLLFNNKKINPFDVDVKALSRETVAFTKSNDSKLIQATVADLIQTKYFKSIDDLNFSGGYSADALKRVKASYLSHFYNFDALEGDKSVFFDKKGNSKLSHSKMSLDQVARIPTFIGLKLRLIEGTTGLGNSDAKVIKTIASSIFTDNVKYEFDNLNFKEEDIDYPKFTANKIEETDETITYYVGEKAKIGYKLD